MTDIKTLYKLWFCPLKGSNHAERLENFYSSQVNSYDTFRKYLLWARPEMLKACASRLTNKTDLVWVDLGGGTGDNIDAMKAYMNLSNFKKIYIVDLCHSMCEKAKERKEYNKWSNVEVIEADACKFSIEKADLITFSYSLSMIPNFYEAVDKAISYLSKEGYLAVCDFGINEKFKMSWYRRYFWRSIFDIDNIDIGPERKNYLKYKLYTEWEVEGEGSIPYVPYFKAPYYIWIGNLSSDNTIIYKNHEVDINHPSFLYHISWEDPKEDEKIMDWNENDVVLTLTGGGCNIFDLLLKNVKKVVTVDINKAQTALMEFKILAFKYLPYDDVWKLFGEGYHADINTIYDTIKYYMTKESQEFWNTRIWYFRKGLYNQGGMGKIGQYVRYFLKLFNINLLNFMSLEDQTNYWNSCTLVKIYKSNNMYLKMMISKILKNEWLCWFGLGVPKNQLDLIEKSMFDYLFDTLDPIMTTMLVKDNYFYYNIFAGKFTKETCPNYLKEENFEKIKNNLHKIKLVNNTLLDELQQDIYTKVILMDHLDWMNETYAETLLKYFNSSIQENGLIQWRSASTNPYYKKIFLNNNFILYHEDSRNVKKLMDHVNMYAYYGVIKKLN